MSGVCVIECDIIEITDMVDSHVSLQIVTKLENKFSHTLQGGVIRKLKLPHNGNISSQNWQ